MRRLAPAALMLSAVAVPAQALETELNLNTYLAGSLRYLESDFETGEDQFEGTNNASRLSLKGSVKNDYARLFGVYDRGLRDDKAGIEPERQIYLGLDTAYGQLLAGKKASEYRLSGERLDPFYDTSVAGFDGRALSEGASYGLSNLSNGYSRNMVSYSTPNLYDQLRVNAAVFLNDKDAPNDEMDYSAGGSLTVPGLVEGTQATVGAQYLKIKNVAAFVAGDAGRNELLAVAGSPGASTSYRAYAAYTAPQYSVGFSFENVDVASEPDARRYYYLAGTYALSETLRLAGSFGYLDFKPGSPELSGQGYSLGLFRKMNANTNAYLAARQVSLDTGGDSSSIAVGLSISFDVKLYPFSFGGGDDETAAE